MRGGTVGTVGIVAILALGLLCVPLAIDGAAAGEHPHRSAG